MATTFRHSGNCGDVLYAIPAMLSLAKRTKIKLHLQLNVDANYVQARGAHPWGSVRLNRHAYDFLRPFLLSQGIDVALWQGERVKYNLDAMRNIRFNFGQGNIPHYYFYAFVNARYDLTQPWLHAEPDTSYKDMVVINRTLGYRNPNVFWKVVPPDNLLFLGTEPEYKSMQNDIPKLKWHPTRTLLECAKIIAGAKAFIGNQSCLYALAEGLKKHNRALEVSPVCPNVVPMGAGSFDFITTNGLMYFLERYIG